MVGVLIQTMPMLSFSVHRVFCVGLGGDVPGVPSGVDSPVSIKDRAHAKHFARAPALEGALTCHLCLFSWNSQGDFPWEPSASLPGVFSPAQWVTEGLGSSQERTCRQQGRPGSSGSDAKAEVPCSAFPQGILEHWECREGRLGSPVWYHLCGSSFSFSAWELLVAGPQCHSSGHSHGIPSQEGAQQLQVSYKLFLVFWSVQSHGSQRVKTPKTTGYQNIAAPGVHSRPAKL